MGLVKTERMPASFCGADVLISPEGAFRIVEDMVTMMMGDMQIDGVTCQEKYGAVWVFVRNRIEMPQLLKWKEEYTAVCSISSFTRARLYVDTVLKKKDGTIALASRLELCAVELDTGKIRKTSSVGVGEGTPAEEPLTDLKYSKEKPIRAELVDEIVVRSSDIDFCKHTNNVSYIRYVMNQLPISELMERPVRGFEIQYVNQTHEGDTLSVYRCESETGEAFTIEHEGRTAVNCLITR